MNPDLLKRITILMSIIFIGLSLLHYFSQRPLWFDEQPLGESLQTYTYPQIFGPLIREQAFPRVYLFLIKVISAPFDFSLLAVRFLPLAAMLAAFFIWKKIFRLFLRNDILYILAILAFAGSYRLTYYAAELKQYSMDVLVAGLYILFLNYQSRFKLQAPPKRLYVLSIVMPFLLFFSYTAIFFFWIIAFNFFLMIIFDGNKKLIPVFLLNTFILLLAFITICAIDLRYSINPMMTQYFQSYYLGTDSLGNFFTPFSEGVQRLATYWYGDTKYFVRAASIFIPFFFFGMLIYGFKALKISRGQIFNLDNVGLIVFLELFVLGLLKKYPFTGDRITLFFAPFTMYIILKAMHGLSSNKFVQWVFLGYFAVFNVTCVANTFYQHLKLYF